MKSIVHRINLDTMGGVENIFSQILQQSDILHDFRNIVLTLNRINNIIYENISQEVEDIYYIKYQGKRKIPAYPKVLRKIHLEKILQEMKPDLFLLWNDFPEPDMIKLLKNINTIYYDHGSLWGNLDQKKTATFLKNVNQIICNSYASKRILNLRFGVDGKICKFGVRPDIAPLSPDPKSVQSHEPFHLGVIGRLRSIKGMPLALHVLKILHERGYQSNLHIAGTGPEKSLLEKLSDKLQLTDKIIFHSYLTDMKEFYQLIDFFLCLSIREPFGMVNIEAASHGCITLGAKVDGIPESVIDGITGFTIKTEIPIEKYPLYGGNIDKDIPRLVYDPENDCLRKPHFVSPTLVAEKIIELIEQPDLYKKTSIRAIQYAKQHFNFNDYVTQLKKICLMHS